jgi:hypothetical protein
MVNGSSVVVEDKIRQALDVFGTGQEELADVGLGIRSGVVEVVVPNVPLGARDRLGCCNMHRGNRGNLDHLNERRH